MAHFAKLDDNNIVTAIHAVDNYVLDSTNEEETGIQYLSNLHNHTNWRQTSYNAATNGFRKNYAVIGATYDPTNDWFVLPKPFPSWHLDENANWQPPFPKPTDNPNLIWNEEQQDFI
jgi:hypothetical protein